MVKEYSEAYSNAYHQALNGMVERQMRASIIKVGSFWYSAWVDAGQPALNQWSKRELTTTERIFAEREELLFKAGRILGRSEDD